MHLRMNSACLMGFTIRIGGSALRETAALVSYIIQQNHPVESVSSGVDARPTIEIEARLDWCQHFGQSFGSGRHPSLNLQLIYTQLTRLSGVRHRVRVCL